MLNQMRSYKSLAIARSLTITLLGLALLAGASFAQGPFDSAGEKQLVELINQERVREGLQPLVVDERLTHAARKHTAQMVKNKALSHQFDDEPSLQVRCADENLRSDRLAENVALEMDVAGGHAILMNSPPHRANILSPKFNAVGIGVMHSGDLVYVTEDFAHRLQDYSELEADAVLQNAITKCASSQGFPAPARKPQLALRDMACNMALSDALDPNSPRSIVGVHRVVAWTATNLEELPGDVKGLLSQPLNSGYSLGACFAPSVSHPGGVYWVVMVTY
jgi:uncharacterized protein YkwD